ncbi:hypothetical protein AZE42_06613 [Rhizopogon vesiculosus]|uniref:Uncharacterized protein n=1 Tax=Rhizopogon vesiculosus TaxID=180088 RepID=A0A1J8QIE1_9AGAM|nr:hypothetical protein AZE42_06613 [Rhizopogon vesiculosus]
MPCARLAETKSHQKSVRSGVWTMKGNFRGYGDIADMTVCGSRWVIWRYRASIVSIWRCKSKR